MPANPEYAPIKCLGICWLRFHKDGVIAVYCDSGLIAGSWLGSIPAFTMSWNMPNCERSSTFSKTSSVFRHVFGVVSYGFAGGTRISQVLPHRSVANTFTGLSPHLPVSVQPLEVR